VRGKYDVKPIETTVRLNRRQMIAIEIK